MASLGLSYIERVEMAEALENPWNNIPSESVEPFKKLLDHYDKTGERAMLIETPGYDPFWAKLTDKAIEAFRKNPQ